MKREPDEPRASDVFNRRQGPAAAKREFKLEAKRILDGWLYRRRLVNRGKYPVLAEEDPRGWMLRCTYRLVEDLIAGGHAGILSDLMSEVSQRHAGKTDISDKPFKQALLVMFWWNPSVETKDLIDRRRRSELSDAMEYAHLHYVSPKDLNRFIKLAGIKHIPFKLRTGNREPGFSVRQLPEDGPEIIEIIG